MLSAVITIVFVGCCIYNFLEGFKNPGNQSMIIDGDYYAIGKMIGIRPEPKLRRRILENNNTPIKPTTRQSRKNTFKEVTVPIERVNPDLLSDCILAAKSIGFTGLCKQEIEDFIVTHELGTVQQFIVSITKKKK